VAALVSFRRAHIVHWHRNRAKHLAVVCVAEARTLFSVAEHIPSLAGVVTGRYTRELLPRPPWFWRLHPHVAGRLAVLQRTQRVPIGGSPPRA
jgi:hypothetical protein